jgi:hypothetical protein
MKYNLADLLMIMFLPLLIGIEKVLGRRPEWMQSFGEWLVAILDKKN